MKKGIQRGWKLVNIGNTLLGGTFFLEMNPQGKVFEFTWVCSWEVVSK